MDEDEEFWNDDEEYGDDEDDDGDMDVDEAEDLNPAVHFDDPVDDHSPTHKIPYRIVDPESLRAMQQQMIKQVEDLTGVTRPRARTLLIFFRWDVEAVMSEFIERGVEELMRSAGIVSSEEVDTANAAPTPKRAKCDVVFSCESCFDDVDYSKTEAIECGHRFCRECWTSHCEVRVRERSCNRIPCMATDCNVVLNSEKVLYFLESSESSLVDRYESTLLDSYIEDNPLVSWCPSQPHCGNAAESLVGDNTVFEVDCSCGHQWCFACTEPPHSPASCSMWSLWRSGCSTESQTSDWITANTKPCPKCNKAVEKNGGCNLVQCRCGQCFCWFCGGATGSAHTWTTIEGHSCGRYREQLEKKQSAAERNLQRYMHYRDRYDAHQSSLRLERESAADMVRKIAALERSGLLKRDLGWQLNGERLVLRCRRALAFSYVFAFYMFGEIGGQATAAAATSSSTTLAAAGEVPLADSAAKRAAGRGGGRVVSLAFGKAARKKRKDAAAIDLQLEQQADEVVAPEEGLLKGIQMSLEERLIKKGLFEDYQQQFESMLERLSACAFDRERLHSLTENGHGSSTVSLSASAKFATTTSTAAAVSSRGSGMAGRRRVNEGVAIKYAKTNATTAAVVDAHSALLSAEAQERMKKKELEFEEDLGRHRLQTVNLTAVVDTACKRMYEFVSDMLASMQTTTHEIAPYLSLPTK